MHTSTETKLHADIPLYADDNNGFLVSQKHCFRRPQTTETQFTNESEENDCHFISKKGCGPIDENILEIFYMMIYVTGCSLRIYFICQILVII